MRPQTFTDDDAIDALIASGGVVATAAETLGVTRQALYSRIRSSELLQGARDDGRNELLDVAESQLFEAVRKGRPWAVKFVLSRLAKDRGYSLGLKVEGTLEQFGQVVIEIPDNGRDSLVESLTDSNDWTTNRKH